MTERVERRARRREERRRRGVAPGSPIKPLVNKLTLTETLSEEGLNLIHQASMRLLKETGMLIVDGLFLLET